jgi:hypothetical protein
MPSSTLISSGTFSLARCSPLVSATKILESCFKCHDNGSISFAYLHCVGPASLGKDERDVNILFVSILAFEMGQIDFLFLEMFSIALGQVKALSQTLDSSRAIATIALIVAMSQSMLLLHVSNHLEHFWEKKLIFLCNEINQISA